MRLWYLSVESIIMCTVAKSDKNILLGGFLQMKKIIALVLALVLAFGLVACNNGGDQSSTASGSSTASDASTASTGGDDSGDLITVGFSQVGAESAWRTANTKSIQEALTEENGFELIFSDGQQKQEIQITALRSFIEQGVDYIAFSPTVESGWDDVLNEIKEADIPLILVDRTTDNPDESLYVTWMGSDFHTEGVRAGEWVIAYLEDKGLMDGEVVIAELQGTVGAAAATDRMAGFKEVMDKYSNINIKYSQTGDFTTAKGQEVMEAFLKSDTANEIKVLFAHNDDMAIGAITAIEAAGRKSGEDICIISCDGGKAMFQNIVDGKANCVVECNPLLGEGLADVIKKLEAGEEVEKKTYSEEDIFDQNGLAGALKAADHINERAY